MPKDLVLIGVVVATLALMVIPLNQGIIDVLLALNISLSVLMLMVAIYLRHPSDFSTFPSVILLGTAFRLSLSVGTTRLILSEADAGSIIETFGDFVVSGSIAIGMVTFLIITVVQFLVVTKGAERVAEVAARFALDALPGKQMSIDAEVRAGNLEAEQAAILRKRLDKDSQFFGAMDGAMKFVKGDAIAGLIIISINLIGGIAVGVSLHGYTFGEAVSIFSLLTVGDGLVAQIPALLMSLCAGVIVTRIANQDNDDLGTDIADELVSDPRVPAVASVIVLAIGLIPGFPSLVFAILAAILMMTAMELRRAHKKAKDVTDAEAVDAERETTDLNDLSQELPSTDRFKLLLGRTIATEVDNVILKSYISSHFGALHSARGVAFPTPVVVVSNFIEEHEIVMEMDEVPIFRYVVPSNCVMISDHQTQDIILGFDDSVIIPFTSGVLVGLWVNEKEVQLTHGPELERMSIEEVLAYITYRFYEQNLGSLFSYQIFNNLLTEMRLAEPIIMPLIEEEMNSAALYKMFRYLIEDGVPLIPLTPLLGSLHYWLHSISNPTSVTLAECLRGSMKRQLCHRIAGRHGILGIAMVDPALEELALGNIGTNRSATSDPANDGLVFSSQVCDNLLAQFRDLLNPLTRGAKPIAVVASSTIRRRLRNFLAANNLHIPVLAPHEITLDIPTHPLELIKLPRGFTKSDKPTINKTRQRRKTTA